MIVPKVVSGGSFILISLLHTPFYFLITTTSSSSLVADSAVLSAFFFIYDRLQQYIILSHPKTAFL
jgi:hypothetical protein